MSRAFGDVSYKLNDDMDFRDQKVICVCDVRTHRAKKGVCLSLLIN